MDAPAQLRHLFAEAPPGASPRQTPAGHIVRFAASCFATTVMRASRPFTRSTACATLTSPHPPRERHDDKALAASQPRLRICKKIPRIHRTISRVSEWRRHGLACVQAVGRSREQTRPCTHKIAGRQPKPTCRNTSASPRPQCTRWCLPSNGRASSGGNREPPAASSCSLIQDTCPSYFDSRPTGQNHCAAVLGGGHRFTQILAAVLPHRPENCYHARALCRQPRLKGAHSMHGEFVSTRTRRCFDGWLGAALLIALTTFPNAVIAQQPCLPLLKPNVIFNVKETKHRSFLKYAMCRSRFEEFRNTFGAQTGGSYMDLYKGKGDFNEDRYNALKSEQCKDLTTDEIDLSYSYWWSSIVDPEARKDYLQCLRDSVLSCSVEPNTDIPEIVVYQNDPHIAKVIVKDVTVVNGRISGLKQGDVLDRGRRAFSVSDFRRPFRFTLNTTQDGASNTCTAYVGAPAPEPPPQPEPPCEQVNAAGQCLRCVGTLAKTGLGANGSAAFRCNKVVPGESYRMEVSGQVSTNGDPAVGSSIVLALRGPGGTIFREEGYNDPHSRSWKLFNLQSPEDFPAASDVLDGALLVKACIVTGPSTCNFSDDAKWKICNVKSGC